MATYQRATRAFEELGDHRNAIGSLVRLGDTRLAQSDREGARAARVRALENTGERAMRHSTQQVRSRPTALDMDADPTPAAPERAAGNHRLPVRRSGGPAHQDLDRAASAQGRSSAHPQRTRAAGATNDTDSPAGRARRSREPITDVPFRFDGGAGTRRRRDRLPRRGRTGRNGAVTGSRARQVNEQQARTSRSPAAE